MNKGLIFAFALLFVGQQVSAIDDLCTDIHFQLRPHPDNCRQYITCLAGNAVVFNCEAGEFFYEPLNRCLVGSDETCQVYVPTCENEFFAFHPDAFDCGRYYACLNYQLVIFQCPAYQIFNRQTNQCAYGNQNTCQLM